jgi:ribonuclease R
LGKVRSVTGEAHQYEAKIIRKISTAPSRVLGVFRKTAEGGRIVPIDKSGKEWTVPEASVNGARDGELVEAQQSGPKTRLGLPVAKIMDRLGDPTAPKAVSLIAIHQHGIPDDFPTDVIAEADAKKPAPLKGRKDLRDIPLVTIDPADARDHDDAVFAELDTGSANAGGFILWVAIADVAHYVTPGSQLDREAWKRGNSTYFPDRVVPMLPDRLSGDLCSLHEGVPRACIALRMVLNAQGDKISHEFYRAMMKSAASLTYEEVQAAMNGRVTERTEPYLETVIQPLYATYAALAAARARRQPLDLDLPERRIELSDDGKVASVAFKDRLDAHRLIEECMVLANVAAAETLIAKKTPLLFRVHEEPSQDKLEALRETAQAAGLVLAKGQVLRTKHLNQLLQQAKGTDEAELINMSTLRSMTQAYYAPQNFGHFGLALRNYAHFTSPIRRYADLIVHRALIASHGWGNDGLKPEEIERLEETGNNISTTERRSMVAERDTVDRYLAAYLSERKGNEFDGRISGVAKFGIFVRIDDSGADGIVPVRSLGREFFHHDPQTNTLVGSDTGLALSLGMRVTVRLTEAEPIAGGIAFELLSVNDAALPRSPRKFSKSSKKKMALAKKKDGKIKRKVQRRRG